MKITTNRVYCVGAARYPSFDDIQEILDDLEESLKLFSTNHIDGYKTSPNLIEVGANLVHPSIKRPALLYSGVLDHSKLAVGGEPLVADLVLSFSGVAPLIEIERAMEALGEAESDIVDEGAVRIGGDQIHYSRFLRRSTELYFSHLFHPATILSKEQMQNNVFSSILRHRRAGKEIHDSIKFENGELTFNID